MTTNSLTKKPDWPHFIPLSTKEITEINWSNWPTRYLRGKWEVRLTKDNQQILMWVHGTTKPIWKGIFRHLPIRFYPPQS